MPRYIVTVDRAGIDKGIDAPIRVQDTRTGEVVTWAKVEIRGSSVIVYGPEREDGAVVWIECDGYSAIE